MFENIPYKKIALYFILFIIISMITDAFLHDFTSLWLFPTSILGFIFGYGDARFVFVGDLITTNIVFLILTSIYDRIIFFIKNY